MTRLTDRIVILLLCSAGILSGISAPFVFSEPLKVVALLCIIIVSAIGEICSKDKKTILFTISAFVYCLLGIQFREFVFFVPIIVYEAAYSKCYIGFAAAISLIMSRLVMDFRNMPLTLGNASLYAYISIISVAAVLIAMRSSKIRELHEKILMTRDNAAEQSNNLITQNKQLIASQDSEIHIATLKERNRIAREIHDNVGHLLTRTILQMGAVCIINKDEQLKEPLESIKDTLDNAMTTIRKSVHDLHDDSIDLKSSLKEAIAPLGENYTVHFDYDASNTIEPKVKYCFIAVVKEAVNNIIKHSDATEVRIIVRDHPKFTTLLVEDNGTNAKLNQSGIGLQNIRDRVDSLGGIANISAEKTGFRIFISIVKKD